MARARFQGASRKVKRGGGIRFQRKSMTYGPLETIPVKYEIGEGPLFVKRRVRSVDEQGSLLHSNLSSGLAAAKTYDTQQMAAKLPPSPTCQHIERREKEDDDLATSSLGHTLLCHGVSARQFAENTSAAGNGSHLLATTGVCQLSNSAVSLAESKTVSPASEAEKEGYLALTLLNRKDPSLTIGELQPERTHVPGGKDHGNDPIQSLLAPAKEHSALQAELTNNTLTDSCAVEDDDKSFAPSTARDYQSSDHVKSHSPLSIASTQPQNRRSTILQRVVTLFAGRRRCEAAEERRPSRQVPLNEQREVIVPSTNLQWPQLTASRGAVHFDECMSPKPITPKNLPLSAPILARHRPYLPVDERLDDECFVEPAKKHKHTGTCYVTPDIFEPIEVQHGFTAARTPKVITSPTRRFNPDGELLERDDTAWAKWFAKHPTIEYLPFAKSEKNQQRSEEPEDELTDLQAWDAHKAYHSKFREAPALADANDSFDLMNNEEYERAARLRCHPEDCFGALTGDVYPFHHGLVI